MFEESGTSKRGGNDPMNTEYTVKLIDRGEAVEYRDDVDVYHFATWHKRKGWVVYLPGTKGKYHEPHELTDDEEAVIFPRIRSYLEGIKYFIWFGRRHPVSFEREAAISSEMKALRMAIPKYLKRRDGVD